MRGFNYKLPVVLGKSIEKCWRDNRDLCRQVVNGIETGIRERTKLPDMNKCSENSRNHLHMDKQQCKNVDNEYNSNHDEVCSIVEG